MNNTSSLSSNNNTLDSNERSKYIDKLEHSFIIFILKKLSHKDSPMSAAKIANYMSYLTGEDHAEKTILKKIRAICALQSDSKDHILENTLWLTFGGAIIEVSNMEKKGIKKKQSRFYFQPLMHQSDLALVCGSISSNRYLSDSEKTYLISREMTLSSLNADTNTLTKQIDGMAKDSLAYDYLKDSPKSSVEQHSTLLRHINHLYEAIKNGYMVEIIYGVYDIPKKGEQLNFHAKNPDKPYLLNPYAMLWNNDAFYLLATHSGHNNPVHFRIDRIISIKDVVTEDDATIKKLRAPLPEVLKPFFNFTKGKTYEFLPEKYTATYPLMGIYNDTNYQDCYIECTSGTLSILIDTFGTTVRIFPSNIPHSEDELDFHGRPQHFIIVAIKQVQYDNIVQFCLQQHTSVTAIYPRQLVIDVRDALKASADKYTNLSKFSLKPPNLS